jgi:predicted RNase H-like HicB family nuclease
MEWELTAMFRAMNGGFAARTKEFPDIHAHGATLDEARENLRSAVREAIQSSRARAGQELAGVSFLTERMVITREADGTRPRSTILGT